MSVVRGGVARRVVATISVTVVLLWPAAGALADAAPPDDGSAASAQAVDSTAPAEPPEPSASAQPEPATSGKAEPVASAKPEPSASAQPERAASIGPKPVTATKPEPKPAAPTSSKPAQTPAERADPATRARLTQDSEPTDAAPSAAAGSATAQEEERKDQPAPATEAGEATPQPRAVRERQTAGSASESAAPVTELAEPVVHAAASVTDSAEPASSSASSATSGSPITLAAEPNPKLAVTPAVPSTSSCGDKSGSISVSATLAADSGPLQAGDIVYVRVDRASARYTYLGGGSKQFPIKNPATVTLPFQYTFTGLPAGTDFRVEWYIYRPTASSTSISFISQTGIVVGQQACEPLPEPQLTMTVSEPEPIMCGSDDSRTVTVTITHVAGSTVPGTVSVRDRRPPETGAWSPLTTLGSGADGGTWTTSYELTSASDSIEIQAVTTTTRVNEDAAGVPGEVAIGESITRALTCTPLVLAMTATAKPTPSECEPTGALTVSAKATGESNVAPASATLTVTGPGTDIEVPMTGDSPFTASLADLAPGEYSYSVAYSGGGLSGSTETQVATVTGPSASECELTPALTVDDPAELNCGESAVTAHVSAQGTIRQPWVALYERGDDGDTLVGEADSGVTGPVAWDVEGLTPGSQHTWIAVGAPASEGPWDWQHTAEQIVTMPQQRTGCSDPVVPGDPQQPGDPVDPKDPQQPSDPQQPIRPADPVVPGDPQPPSKPIAPTEPQQPSEPVVPADPQRPSEPAGPPDSQQPSNSVESTDPQQRPSMPVPVVAPGAGSQPVVVDLLPITGPTTNLLATPRFTAPVTTVPAPMLPATGDAGIMRTILASIALSGVGTLLVVVRRRRQDETR